MLDGKKSTSQKVVYGALDQIQKRLDKDKLEQLPKTSIEVFRQAIDRAKPDVEVRSRRVGGTNYQVPMQVTQARRQSLAFRWIIQAARGESGKPMSNRLARELYDAANGEGKAANVRDNTHRMADANKAFAHFAW